MIDQATLTKLASSLPDGWKLEVFAEKYLLLTGPHGGATIDLEQRGVRFGWNVVHGLMVNEKVMWSRRRRIVTRPIYKGRGWQQKLVAAAVDALRSLPR